MSLKRVALVVFLILIVCSLSFFDPAASAEDLDFRVKIDFQLIKESPGAAAAWLAYAATLAHDMEKEAQPSEGIFISFADELDARTVLVQVWKAKKSQKTQANAYLDQLELVYDSGFLGEYVFYYLNKYNWVAPDSLRMMAFKAWQETNLPGHQPLTLALVTRK